MPMRAVFLVLMLLLTVPAAAEEVRLGQLDVARVRQGWGKPQVDKSVTQTPLSIGGEKYAHGVGSHARSVILVDLGGGSDRFTATCGVDDNAGKGKGTVQFKVIVDGKTVWQSPVMKCGQKAERVDVDLRGAKMMILLAGDGGDDVSYDHADWAEAVFHVSGRRPAIVSAPVEPAVILTPPPPAEPRINGPKVLGCRPGNPFIYRVPATGERPMTFAAENLPAGLVLDPATGIVTGTNPPRGEYMVTLKAKNARGEATRALKIVSGDRLALTPPMGWNHWYAHYNRVTDKMVREAADVMVRSGMADVGYQYVNIDDCWSNAPKYGDPKRAGPARDAQGNIVCNQYFPDMNALTAYIHAKGLRAGIYTSPGPLTCAGFAAAYQHEAQDARQFAEWGFDFLKYDWCSYGGEVKGKTDRETLQKPYRQMGRLLQEQKRDMVFNLCQYGMGDVWEWGAEVGGHSWRTGGDLGFELDRIFEVALKNVAIRKYNKPGQWNDPDYIQIGYIGAATSMGEPIPCGITPNEQYSFMSLWCLMAAPLFYSGDMSRLDPFTLNVLCNPEVIAVDQDPLGICAEARCVTDEGFVLVKPLEDGSRAVGLFNRGEWETEMTVTWSQLGLKGSQKVRDLWRQKDLGVIEREHRVRVPRHGTVVLRLEAAQ